MWSIKERSLFFYIYIYTQLNTFIPRMAEAVGL